MPEVIFGPRRNAAARKLAASQNTDKHPNWGGRRPGSGRKPAGERPLDAMIVVRIFQNGRRQRLAAPRSGSLHGKKTVQYGV